MEAAFELLNGVEDVVSGYANGDVPNPDYKMVCSGTSGYAEVVKITYDEDKISVDTLLKVFFELHDPTTLNRQGGDRGTQYRSTILYTDKDTKKRALKAKLKAQDIYCDDIVTVIEPLENFHLAEDYHQDYFRLNGNQGYCMAVVAPKVQKVKDKFSDKM